MVVTLPVIVVYAVPPGSRSRVVAASTGARPLAWSPEAPAPQYRPAKRTGAPAGICRSALEELTVVGSSSMSTMIIE